VNLAGPNIVSSGERNCGSNRLDFQSVSVRLGLESSLNTTVVLGPTTTIEHRHKYSEFLWAARVAPIAIAALGTVRE